MCPDQYALANATTPVHHSRSPRSFVPAQEAKPPSLPQYQCVRAFLKSSCHRRPLLQHPRSWLLPSQASTPVYPSPTINAHLPQPTLHGHAPRAQTSTHARPSCLVGTSLVASVSGHQLPQSVSVPQSVPQSLPRPFWLGLGLQVTFSKICGGEGGGG